MFIVTLQNLQSSCQSLGDLDDQSKLITVDSGYHEAQNPKHPTLGATSHWLRATQE